MARLTMAAAKGPGNDSGQANGNGNGMGNGGPSMGNGNGGPGMGNSNPGMGNGNSGMGNGNNPGQGHGNGHGAKLSLGASHLTSSMIGSQLVQITGVEAFADAEQFYFTTFKALNGSGVSGAAIVALDEDTNEVTVHISASGLEPGMVHPQHIHGFLDGTEARVPTARVDRVLGDSDGFIELTEGLNTYGPILLNLTLDTHNADGHDHGTGALDFPIADANGVVLFTQTYDLDEMDVLLEQNLNLELHEIVLHGLTLEDGEGANGGEANGEAGYKAVLPVAAGALQEVNSKGDLMKLTNAGDFDRSSHNGMPDNGMHEMRLHVDGINFG